MNVLTQLCQSFGRFVSQIMNNEKFAGFSKWHAGGDA